MNDYTKSATLLVTLLTAVWCDTTPAKADRPGPKMFYVATDGNDSWSGTLPAPNGEKTDGPFATLQRARDAIRKLKQAGGLPKGGVVVELRGGTYERSEPLELTAEDSGTEASPIVYRARAGEEVRLTGGRPVTGFQPVTDPAVLERLDESARSKVVRADLKALGITDFGPVQGGGLEVFFEDKPMTLARWPNKGFIHIVDLVGGKPVDVRGTKGDKIGKFFYEGDRPKRWVDEKDAWVHGYWFWDWSDQRHKIESIDPARRVIAVVPPYHHYGYRKGQWFYGLNLLSEIDSPGEWYLDRETGVLYFWPPGPVEKNSTTVSLTKTLITMQDVSHVTVRGLIIELARGTAVTITGSAKTKIAGCTLRNLGGWAVRISGGKAGGVVSCDIYDTGDGGIGISGGDRKTLTPAGHYALNNHIYRYGRWNRMYKSAVATHGVGNRIAHNLIHDAPHMAISFGGNDHVIELNEIHHVCYESNDAGAMYAGRDWTMRGTVIRHNFLHHVSGFKDRGCVGVYLDDMFSGTRICGNVFYKATRAAFIGGGRDNVVEKNIFVDCPRAMHMDARALGWAAPCAETTMRTRLTAMPYKVPPWSRRYPRLVNILNDEPAAPKGNLIARNVFQGDNWDDITRRARPFVTMKDNLPIKDAGFVDPAQMNFQLRDDSPVYKKLPGFEKIPFEKIGLVADEYRKKLPTKSQ